MWPCTRHLAPFRWLQKIERASPSGSLDAVIGVDLFEIKDHDGVNRLCLNTICWGTSLQDVVVIENKTPSEVLHYFCTQLLRSGVCSAAIFSSSHKTATDVLFTGLFRSGIKGLAGMTLMNRMYVVC